MSLTAADCADSIIPQISLTELIDFDVVSSMMDSFYGITGIPMSILDINGNILAGAGWQEICTKFHRVHPETLRNCINSDTILTADIPNGESRLYRCGNGMWDMATPLFFDKHRIGNLFTGQFFFTDEEPDMTVFKQQASGYGFDEPGYMAALERVPRLERRNVELAKSLMIKLAGTLAELGFSRMKLEKALTDTQVLLSNLKKSKYLLEQSELIAHLGSWEFDLQHNRLTWSDEVYRIFGVSPVNFDPSYMSFLERVHPEDRETVDKTYTESLHSEKKGYDIEHRIIRDNTGEIRWVHEKCRHFMNRSGEIIRSVGMIHDITERKKTESEIIDSHERLKIAFEIASIGTWKWHIKDDRFQADDRMLSMLQRRKKNISSIKELESLISAEDMPDFRETLAISVKNGTRFETIITVKLPRGRLMHLDVRAMINKAGDEMSGVCFDITSPRGKKKNYI